MEDQIFATDFSEKVTPSADDKILLSDINDGGKIKYGRYSKFKGEKGDDGATPTSAAIVGDDIVFTKDDGNTVTITGAVTTLKGEDGREIELQTTATYIQWRYVGDTSWTNLIAISAITGPAGEDGACVESVSFVGDDMVFVLDDSSTVTLVGAKTTLKGDPGIDGTDGNGIVSILKTASVGLIDTYTITYTDSSTTTFNVTNGEDGTDGTNGTDGNGIVSVTLISTVGKVKTYRILFTNSSTFDFIVTDGEDGTGSGDVMGPATNTDNYIPQRDGTNSKTLKNGIPLAAVTNRFNGACQIPTLTDNGDGTITLGSGDYCLSSNVDGSGVITTYTLSGLTNQALTDLSMNYIVANYNGGSPVLQVITDVTIINETTIVPIYSIFRNGNILHTQNRDALGLALANKVHQSIVKTQRYRRESGLSLSETGTRNMILSSGKIRVGAIPMALDTIETATDNAFLWYHNGGVRTQSVVAQYNNTQYDDGTNLATLGTGRYAVNWIFRGVESQKHLYIVLGTGDYTLNQAESATLPALPTAISSHAVLVAKLIVQKSAGTATSIQSAFDVQFGLSAVQAHNDTTGRDAEDSHPIGAITGLQTALDGKVDENATITGATKTKITYDSKGLVTAGADATTADIAESTDRKYITDAEETAIGTIGNKLDKSGGTMTGKVIGAGRTEVAKTYTPASGSQTVALDCAVNNMHVVTGNASGTAMTFTVANATDSQPFIVSILQGSTPSTIAGRFATVRRAGGTAPTLTAVANKRDTFGFIRTGTNTYDGFVIGQNC